MAKRYYQSKKDRRDESRGMKKYEARVRRDREDESRGMHDFYLRDYYSGLEGRRRMEDEGSSMIHEDRRAIANLPQDVKMKAYPYTNYMYYELNDTIAGIDVQIHDDVKTDNKTGKPFPEKY